MSKQILSEPQPCSKCLKKYSQNLENWTPCNNCTWTTKEIPTLKQEKEKLSSIEKTCMECQEILNFIELEKDKYLCGKVKCLRNYIQGKSEKEK